MINNHLQHDHITAEPGTSIGDQLARWKGSLGVYYFLFVLMQSSGCRISEALEITPGHISSEGKALIKGKKGSEDRFISDDRARAFLLKSKSIERPPFLGCNIFTALRHLKRIGLQTQKKGRKRLTVSGIFRESFAKEIREVDTEQSRVSKFIGHKVAKNGEFYGKG
jgi:integrase